MWLLLLGSSPTFSFMTRNVTSVDKLGLAFSKAPRAARLTCCGSTGGGFRLLISAASANMLPPIRNRSG